MRVGDLKHCEEKEVGFFVKGQFIGGRVIAQLHIRTRPFFSLLYDIALFSFCSFAACLISSTTEVGNRFFVLPSISYQCSNQIYGNNAPAKIPEDIPKRNENTPIPDIIRSFPMGMTILSRYYW